MKINTSNENWDKIIEETKPAIREIQSNNKTIELSYEMFN